ncbi:MAG: hypothetical protein RR022_03745 [Angelakisella sp.]
MQNAARKFIEDTEEYNELYGYTPYVEEAPPKLTVTRRRSFLAGISRVRLLLCAAMVVAVVSLSIYNNVAMVELGDHFTQQTATLAELSAQGERLQSQMDNAISLMQVADNSAATMLMGKAESYQITYISLGDEDTIERTTKTPDQLPLQKVMKTLSKLQEYMHNR